MYGTFAITVDGQVNMTTTPYVHISNTKPKPKLFVQRLQRRTTSVCLIHEFSFYEFQLSILKQMTLTATLQIKPPRRLKRPAVEAAAVFKRLPQTRHLVTSTTFTLF